MKGVNHVEYWTCSNVNCKTNCANGFKKCPVCGLARNGVDTTERANTVAKRPECGSLVKAKPIAQALFKDTEKLRIVIVRGYRGKPLDYDNLVGGCKALRDEISRELLGRDDAESDLLDWEYQQEKAGLNRIEIFKEK